MTVDRSLALLIGWLGCTAGAALLPGDRERRLAGAGLLTLALGIAAWRAVAPAGAPLAAPDRLGDGFLVVNGGLLLVGTSVLLAGAAVAAPGPLRSVAQVGIGLGTVLFWIPAATLLTAAGPLRALGAAVALGIAAAGVGAGGRALPAGGRVPRWIQRALSAPLGVDARWPGPTGSMMVLAASVLAVASAPHVAVVFLGVIAGTWAAFFMLRPPAARPVPVAPVLTLVLLPAYWLLATIAGSPALSRRALPDVPVSPAAEVILAPMLLLAAWASAALWPLHRQMAGALTAPLGVLLLMAIGLPLARGGLEYWQPVTVPLLTLGLWHAAAHARWPLLAAGAAVLGVAGAIPVGASGAPWLVASGLSLELLAGRASGLSSARLIRLAVWLAAAWGGLQVLEGGLRGEVVYTALGASGLAVIIGARARRVPMPP